MRERIVTNWTLTRAFFLIMGLVVIIQSIIVQHWFGVIFGSYFASMGLFAFGCAAGNCYTGKLESEPNIESSDHNFEVDFEEVTKK
jgi:hypothetical protein